MFGRFDLAALLRLPYLFFGFVHHQGGGEKGPGLRGGDTYSSGSSR